MISLQEEKLPKIYYYSTLTFYFSVVLNVLISIIIYVNLDSYIPPLAYFIGATISYLFVFLITDYCESFNPYVKIKIIISILLDIVIASITYIVSISLMFGTKALSSYNIEQCNQAENANNTLKNIVDVDIFQCQPLDFSLFLSFMDSFSSSPFAIFYSPIYFTIFLFIFVHILTLFFLYLYSNFISKNDFHLMP